MFGIRSDINDGQVGIFAKKQQGELELVKEQVSESFEQIKEQFEDHLEAINENTNEIQSNFEYLCELDSKIDKLNEKIEKLALILQQQSGVSAEKKAYSIKALTAKEKEVFYAVYVLTEHNKYTTYKDVARRVGYTESLVASYMTSLVEKGIPISKKYSSKLAYITLEPEFRELQAKENIVGINTLLTYWV